MLSTARSFGCFSQKINTTALFLDRAIDYRTFRQRFFVRAPVFSSSLRPLVFLANYMLNVIKHKCSDLVSFWTTGLLLCRSISVYIAREAPWAQRMPVILNMLERPQF